MTTCPACTNPAQRLVAVFRQGRRDEMCPDCAARAVGRHRLRQKDGGKG